MLRKLPFFNRFFDRGSTDSPLPAPVLIPRDQHQVSRKDISRAALNVLYDLHKGGYDAYLVGGCLRDILTGSTPKDFDVVTNAHPDEIHALFRRSRVIGRRFKLVHVRFGGDVIEVATFRALANDDPDEDDDRSHSEQGQILRDNVYGTIEEDAVRRDFTINALYYNIADFSLLDFTHAIKDIDARLIRLIGDPVQRYREDPVRMLRAVRFAAKLGFTIEPATEAPIRKLAHLMTQVPPARLFDEVIKVFLTGHATPSLALLESYGLLAALFPDTAAALNEADSSDQILLAAAMRNTDRRLAEDKPVTPAFLYAVLMWPALRQQMAKYRTNGMSPAEALHKAESQVIDRQLQTITIPRRFTSVIREIWDLQSRLERRHTDRVAALAAHPRFRGAYDFLLLREESGEITPGAGDWWTRYQQTGEQERQTLLDEVNRTGTRGRKRRRRRPRKASGSDD